MDKTEKTKRISFSAIAVSFAFLFNPSISIVDILPDFIGYIILTVALTKLADMNDTFFEVQRKFRFLIVIDAVKILALFWAFSMASGNERNSSLLLWSFVFAVLDMVFLIPALIKLFSGMTELAYAHESTYLLGTSKKRKTPTDRIRALSVFFVVFKATVSFLPELTELTSSYYWELMINPPKFNLYRYVGALRFLAMLLILAVGIFWLVRIMSYFGRVGKDKIFMDSLNTAYAEKVLTKKGIFIKRRVSIASVLILAAIVLSFDFRFDGVNVIPDILSVPLFAIALSTLGKVVKVSKIKSAIFCTLAGVGFAAYYVMELIFQQKFYNNGLEIIWRDEVAMELYIITLALAVLAGVAFVLLAGFALRCYSGVISLATEPDITDERNARLAISFAEENKKRLDKRLIVCFAAVLACAVADICYAAFSKAFGAMFLINTVSVIALFIIFFNFYLLLGSTLQDKYKLE